MQNYTAKVTIIEYTRVVRIYISIAKTATLETFLKCYESISIVAR